MGFKELLGMKKPEETLGITMTKVTLPFDIAIHLVFRQQEQLFSLFSALQDRIEVAEQVVTLQGERVEHLHKDIVELQQVLEGASKHPVEKTDEETEQKVQKKDERPN